MDIKADGFGRRLTLLSQQLLRLAHDDEGTVVPGFLALPHGSRPGVLRVDEPKNRNCAQVRAMPVSLS
jgi:hypothetical protein